MSPASVGQIVYGQQTVEQLSIQVALPGHQAMDALPRDALEEGERALYRRIERLRLKVALLPIIVCTCACHLAMLWYAGLGLALDRGARLWMLLVLLLCCASQAWWWAGGWWMRQRDALRAARQRRIHLFMLAQPVLTAKPTGGRSCRRSLT